MSNSSFDDFAQSMHRMYTFNIQYKNQSLFMKFLGFLLFFNKDFMTNYITTIGSTIYFPNEDFIKKNQTSAIKVLAHELVHVSQANKYGKILFSILYLFPQCLAIFALLAPISLWFLLFLVCLLPLPAPWRMCFEVDGYTMSLFVLSEHLKNSHKTHMEIMTVLLAERYKINSTYFVGSAYWFMWPFGVASKLENNIDNIINDGIVGKDEIYGCVRQSYLNATSSK